MNEESSKPYNKPGPQTGHTVDIVKTGIVVGRNKVPVPPDEVEHLASLGCTDMEIAKYFGVTDHSLRRHFAAFLVKGRHNLKLSLRQAQLRTALDGNVVMLIWLGKNILQQSDSGLSNEDNQILPWSDDVDLDANAEEDFSLEDEAHSDKDTTGF